MVNLHALLDGCTDGSDAIPRGPNPFQLQIEHINRLVRGNASHCISQLRMDRRTFLQLCIRLQSEGGLANSRHVTLEEKTAIYLKVLAHHTKNRAVGFEFRRSGQTISKHFNEVLHGVIRLQGELLATPEPVSADSTDHVWKYFEGTDTEGYKFGNNVKGLALGTLQDPPETPLSWQFEFERRRKAILELWQFCNVSLVHRTYFFLLFKGDPTDSIYMEVEQRRLDFLKEAFSQGNQAVHDGQTITLALSLKALRRQRETLARLMYKRLSDAERNRLYEKWNISLKSKRRRLQLVSRLWSDINEMNHVTDKD